jgi:hypothetical protein
MKFLFSFRSTASASPDMMVLGVMGVMGFATTIISTKICVSRER